MKRALTLILFLIAVSSTCLYAQTTLKGKVSDNASPLPGVSVINNNTKQVVITDQNGQFQIPVSQGNTITFSYIGYVSKTISYSNQTNLNLVLDAASTSLDEMVVVGYAKQKKATLTGSVSALSGEEIGQRAVASLSTALQGKMAGVTIQQTSGQPGADGSNIRIRGIGSINSTTFPLVLVDGIETDINQVDMNVVESVSVLKDAASASIYGSRASNGVI